MSCISVTINIEGWLEVDSDHGVNRAITMRWIVLNIWMEKLAVIISAVPDIIYWRSSFGINRNELTDAKLNNNAIVFIKLRSERMY